MLIHTEYFHKNCVTNQVTLLRIQKNLQAFYSSFFLKSRLSRTNRISNDYGNKVIWYNFNGKRVILSSLTIIFSTFIVALNRKIILSDKMFFINTNILAWFDKYFQRWKQCCTPFPAITLLVFMQFEFNTIMPKFHVFGKSFFRPQARKLRFLDLSYFFFSVWKISY